MLANLLGAGINKAHCFIKLVVGQTFTILFLLVMERRPSCQVYSDTHTPRIMKIFQLIRELNYFFRREKGLLDPLIFIDATHEMRNNHAIFPFPCSFPA